MTKLSKKEDIWTKEPEVEQIKKGVDYASRSLNWTFNRMGKNAGDWTWFYRMMNIVLGVSVQEVLMDRLSDKDIEISRDTTDYRTEDYFDLSFEEEKMMDIKSSNIYTDSGADRPDFSLDYLMENINYDGPDYRKFFPCAIPDGQFDSSNEKDLYVFALILSRNYHKDKYINNMDSFEYYDKFIISCPSKEDGKFANHKKLVKKREEKGNGLDLDFTLLNNETLTSENLKFFIGYEKEGDFHENEFEISNGESFSLENVSGFSYVRLDEESYDIFSGELKVEINNRLNQKVLTSTPTNLNILPNKTYTFKKEMFANLYPPKNPFKFHFLGWISKEEFGETKEQYPCYAYPDDSKDKYKNQEGDPFKPGFVYRRATCYYYPNVYRGGFKNTNYFILPSDLNIMDDLI